MERLTTLLGKPILTKSGIKLGCVDAVQLDRHLQSIKNIGYTENGTLHYLPFSAIFAHDSDAIILKNATALPYKNCVTIPLGIAVYTVLGEYVGKLIDFTLENFNIVHALLDSGENLSLQICIGITDSIIIDREGKEKKQIATSLQPATTPKKRKKAEQASLNTQKSTLQQLTPIDTAAQKIVYDSLIERDTATKIESIEQPQNNIEKTQAQKTAIQIQPILENGHTAQIVVPEHMAYTSDTHNIPLKDNSLEFTPHLTTSPMPVKSLQEVYATQQFLQQTSKEVGTKVLTGKQLTVDLLDDIGNILIEKYTVIAPEHIKKAIDNNKLFQLIQLLNSV